MSQLNITRTAFNNANIYCGDILISDTKISQPDMFLPILLLLIEKVLADKTLLDKMVTFELIFNQNSLFYIEAKNVNIKNVEAITHLLKEMKGVECILHLFDIVDGNDAQNKGYDFNRMAEYVRGKLSGSEKNQVFDSNIHFEFLFNHITIPSLSTTFIDKQNEYFLSSVIADAIEASKVKSETYAKGSFSITEAYPKLNGVDKKIFQELAVLACASYLSDNLKVTNIADMEKDVTLPVDELLLFSAIVNHSVILDKIADYFNCQSYQVVFDKEVYALREKLQLTATTRSFDVNGTTTTWFMCAKKYAVNLQFNTSITACFAASIQNDSFNIDDFVTSLVELQSPRMKAFLEMNQHGNNTIKTAIASSKIQQALNDKVIGQEAAVTKLCQGYLTSCIESSNGPRLIYTFAGPSGVGKTYLASQLQSQVNEFEKTGYAFNTFNMEQYSDERDAMKLFGSGIQYVDSSLGMLTVAVRSQPRQVLLFDEIEKAHSTVIQSLLSVLDSAKAKDQTSQEEVDFSQCVIIFTTNLGQDVLQNNPQNAELSIFELLRQSENPSNKTKLSPEFVNRLAKGFPILFSELKVNHLIRLAEVEVNKLESSTAQISYDWPQEFASLMLKSMSPDISVRALKSCFAKHKSMILTKAIPYFSDDNKQIKFKVSIEQLEKSNDKPVQLLLLDDDSKVFELVKEQQSACNISLCTDLAGLRHAIESSHPDALLIDVDTINNHDIQLVDVISGLYALNSKTPIFTYQLVKLDDEQIEQHSAHEVREHFRLNLSDFSVLFSNMLNRVNYYLSTENNIFNMTRRNQQLQYQCEVTQVGDIFQANYKRLSVNQLVQSNDLKEGELFKHSLPNFKLDDVIGLERAKKRLVDVVNWLKLPEKLANFGVKVPSGFLFAGPPGTGKTFLAKALAGESGLPFFSVSSSELSESHSGGTTQNIKKLFATARKYAPSIIFIDEIDAIAGQRSRSTQGADRDRNLTVNALLTEMDGFTPQSDPIFIIAATNHPQLLDSAILRPGRFDETIFCDLPNVNARKEFFARFSDKHQIVFSEQELKQLTSSSQGMSSAEIEQVFREAIYQAVGENKALTSEDIKQTMLRVSYGLPSEHIILSAQEKQRTAYHEAGHLLLTKMLFPKQPIDFVTIEPRNNALGFVSTRAANEYESLSSIRVKHRLEVLLAGRVAEKIYTGSVDEISSGATSDIEKATKLAMHVIYEGGLDAAVGPVNVGLLTKFEESDLLLKAQTAVRQWLLDAEASAEARLIEHRDQLDHIANTLVDKESLISDEIEALFL
ncbi:AAA family ATPase [Shewanella electrodiphila]|uniref:AAA family ATPase n=1 Tax=Shewanella electrodiphila TaxID=934143 RepID=A0ABT0KSL9_9GAMM|nr:AAA family ATPase [Shewanella electrodiphila]MCL1046861.1 AAA family ATPase [Shewanella electrodiphila]